MFLRFNSFLLDFMAADTAVTAVEFSAPQVDGLRPLLDTRIQKQSVEDVKVRRVRFEEQSGDPPDPPVVEEFGDITFQERFRVCTVDQVVDQQHFAEQNVDNSVVDVVTSPTRSEQVAAKVDHLSDEELRPSVGAA